MPSRQLFHTGYLEVGRLGQRVQASDHIIETTTTADVESRALWGRHSEALEFLNFFGEH
jgi:hypothetical protein